MKKILIYRFSAMGDVTLLLPVIHGLLLSNNDIEIYLLTRKYFFPLFSNIDRLHLVEADLKRKHKGFFGLYKLHKELKTTINPDVIFDLHKVLRTYILNFFFLLSGYKIYKYSKGRKEKAQSIKTKSRTQLASTIERYSQAFNSADFEVQVANVPLLQSKAINTIFSKLPKSQSVKNIMIGISPFAKHNQKIWNTRKIDALIRKINEHFDVTIFLFGGGSKEILKLYDIAAHFTNCIVSAKYFNLREELLLIPHLQLMLCMDSANMHLASMAGIPTISIWGATHPSLGFYPYQQSMENIIQYTGNELKCRPCSVYGNKKCIYPTVRCMELISVIQVYERIAEILKN